MKTASSRRDNQKTVGGMFRSLFAKPARPSLSEAQIAAAAARYLSQHRQKIDTRVAEKTTALREFVSAGGHVVLRPREVVVAGARRA
jgi:hypothetical protein